MNKTDILNQKFKISRLSFKLIFIFLVLQALLVISISYVYLSKSSSIFEEQFTERGKSLACHLADTSKYAVLTRDISFLEDRVNEVMHQPDVIGVRILDNDGNVIYTSCWTVRGNIQIFKAPVKIEEKFSEDEDILNFSIPKHIKKIGEVEICMSKDRLETQIEDLKKTVSYIALGEFLCIFIIGIIILNKLIIKRINYLTKKVKQISDNPQLDIQVKVNGDDEITTLAKCFNSMQEELKKYIKENIKKTEKLKEQEKLALLGRFSEELRHEVGNSLNDFNAIHDLLCREELNERCRELLTIFFSQIEELRKFNDDIENCFQTPDPELEEHDLTSFLRTQQTAINLLLNSDKQLSLKIVWKIPNKPCKARVELGMINRALENLIINAKSAVDPKTGKIEVGLKCFDKYAEFWVKDNGIGIPKENITKIFDPFFTTKKRGGSSGLGLAIAKSFIEAHKGELIVESEPGNTLFIIRIPRNID